MLDSHRRPDGRKFDEERDIWGEAGPLPRPHGSALFSRGDGGEKKRLAYAFQIVAKSGQRYDHTWSMKWLPSNV